MIATPHQKTALFLEFNLAWATAKNALPFLNKAKKPRVQFTQLKNAIAMCETEKELISYDLIEFFKYPEKAFSVLLHELAHYATDLKVKEYHHHGKCWQNTMRILGQNPERLVSSCFGDNSNKSLILYDLDDTVINSRHRTPNFSDGTLDLKKYMQLHTRENVFKDTLLPLAHIMRKQIRQGYNVGILTARDMKEADYDFLSINGILPRLIMSRDNCKTKEHYFKSDGLYKLEWLLKLKPESLENAVIFDDSENVKNILRGSGFTVKCPHKINSALLKI